MVKAREYQNGPDRLSNFKTAAALQGTTQEAALFGMWAKHIVSVADMVQKMERGGPVPSEAFVAEKITDMINYALLMECVVAELRGEE